jgi:hypothetical protein
MNPPPIRPPAIFALSFSLAFVVPLACGLAQENAPKAISSKDALQMGVEKLADTIKGGEAGEDQACRLFAAAKRLETENRLAQKDLAQVLELDYWRRTLSECIDGFCSLAYGINGGGTMYSHAASRNDAELEEALARLAGNLPLAEGKGDKDSGKKMEKLIAFVRKLEISKDIADIQDESAGKRFLKERESTLAALENLKALTDSAPAPVAKMLVSFVVSNAAWIEFPGADQDPKSQPESKEPAPQKSPAKKKS